MTVSSINALTAAPRGKTRLITLLVAVVVSPLCGIIYAGLTYSRAFKYITVILLGLLFSVSEYVALYATPMADNPISGYDSFIKLQSIIINLMLASLTAVILTQISAPKPNEDKTSRKRSLIRNASIIAIALVVDVSSLYALRGYMQQTHRENADTALETKALNKAIAGWEHKPNDPKALDALRLAALQMNLTAGKPPQADLLTPRAFEIHMIDYKLCSMSKSKTSPFCVRVAQDEAPVEQPKPTRWQAFFHAMNPRNALFTWMKPTQWPPKT